MQGGSAAVPVRQPPLAPSASARPARVGGGHAYHPDHPAHPHPPRRHRRLHHAGTPLIPGTDDARELADHAGSRAEQVLDRLPPTLRSLVDDVRDKEILLYSGGLAFYGLISIAPFVVISFWIAGGLVGEDAIRDLGDNADDFAPGGADISGVTDSLAGIGTGIGIGALAAALWPASAYGSGLVRAFDRICERSKRSLPGVRGRLKALLFVLLLPAFVLGALGASYLTSGLLGDGAALTVLGWVLALVAAFAAGLATVTLIYVVFGPGDLPVRAVVQGAAAASAAIAVMSLGYVVYLGQGADFEERVAGSGLASVVLLALWLYLANAILLTGFALAQSCADAEGDPDAEAEGADADDGDGSDDDDGGGADDGRDDQSGGSRAAASTATTSEP